MVGFNVGWGDRIVEAFVSNLVIFLIILQDDFTSADRRLNCQFQFGCIERT